MTAQPGGEQANQYRQWSAALGLPDVMRPAPAPSPLKQPERPIQATIRLEVNGSVLAETVNKINSQPATRGSNGAYQ